LKSVRFAAAVLVLAASVGAAQTLARPGWAGSGLAAEPWWKSAVFYRIEPGGFQDSDGDGVGDLRGVAQRLDYLQSLGVDAIVLEPPFKDEGIDDLQSEASRRHVRLVVALDQRYLTSGSLQSDARLWLGRGAAGIYLADEVPETQMREIRAVVAGFPGQRVLLSAHVPLATASSGGRGRQQPVGPDMVELQVAEATDDVTAMRHRLERQIATSTPVPLLLTEGEYRTGGAFSMYGEAKRMGTDKIAATLLLTSRGAVSLVYGQEIGMSEGTHIGPQTMQWTPTNVTPPPAAKVEEAVEEAKPKPAADPSVYGAFVPYVPPVKKVEKPVGPVKVDPNSLPGFTSGKLPESSALTNKDEANVAVEDADPNSLLNYYRRLIQLHHGDSSLRSGTPVVFDHDAEKALVWIRRAPARATTAATAVIVCNVTARQMTLSIDRDLAGLHIRPGTLRPLLASWTTTPIAQASGDIVLPPYSAFIGELYHR